MSTPSAPPPSVPTAAAAPPPPAEPQQKEEEDRPFHILMISPTSDQSRELELRDPRIQQDYIARRYKCYIGEDSKKKEKDLWSAVTKVERAMVECCELGVDYSDIVEDDDDQLLYQGGALARGMEYQFVQLLARHCHTAVTRALALAILQHTIEQDEIDAQEEEEEREKELGESETERNEDTDTNEKTDDQSVDKSTEEQSKSENVYNDDVPKEKGSVDQTESVHEDQQQGRIPRMHRFYEAGGMQILKQWLVDASTPAKKVIAKQPASTSTGMKKREYVTTIANSSTGPLLLPLLSVLKGMPLDKNLVTETKINKQIRNLKKQLDEAVCRRISENGDRLLDQWRTPIAGGSIVVEVQEAIESLMDKWKEKAKASTMQVDDPFVALRDTMRERLGALTQYETGSSSKPYWLSSLEETERIAKEKKELSKLTTRQLEARQREQERTEVIHAMQHKQKEIKEKMAKMLEKKREEARKRKAEVQEVQLKKKAKRVKWKDGFDNSDTLRKRRLLEEVFRYPAESSERWEDDGLAEDGQETAIKEEEDDSFDMFGDGEINSRDAPSGGEELSSSPFVAVKEDPDFV